LKVFQPAGQSSASWICPAIMPPSAASSAAKRPSTSRTAGTSFAPEAWAILLASPTMSCILAWKRTLDWWLP
jgi:hypothetical protein